MLLRITTILQKIIKLLYFFSGPPPKKTVMLKINFPLRAKSSFISFLDDNKKRLVLDTAMPALFPYF